MIMKNQKKITERFCARIPIDKFMKIKSDIHKMKPIMLEEPQNLYKRLLFAMVKCDVSPDVPVTYPASHLKNLKTHRFEFKREDLIYQNLSFEEKLSLECQSLLGKSENCMMN